MNKKDKPAPKKYYAPGSDWFNREGLTPPETISHGTEDDIASKLERLEPYNWRLEGNKLTADTKMGKLVQMIPPNYICVGMDNKGLPRLQKIKV